MRNPNYKVCRDNIYVGEVAKTNSIYRYEGDTDFFRTKPGQLNTGSWFHYRSMLFVPSEQKLADDLLYSATNYPILNITDDDICLGINTDTIIIKDACNLAQLLEYLNYNQELTFEDLVDIRKKLFTGRFAMDNCELFGWKEDQPEDWTYYEGYNQPITDSRRIKQKIADAKKDQNAGHRMFTGTSEGILRREYWDVLDSMGNKRLIDVLSGERINAFTPAEEEGLVKKLKRF